VVSEIRFFDIYINTAENVGTVNNLETQAAIRHIANKNKCNTEN